MTNCLFCKIAIKEIPADIIYENADAVAFLDIKPVNPGHVLVIPKIHSSDFSEMDPVDREAVISLCHRVGQALLHLGIKGFNVTTNAKATAGQTVFHTHFHVIPRHDGDGLQLWPQHPYKEGEDKVWQSKLSALLKH